MSSSEYKVLTGRAPVPGGLVAECSSSSTNSTGGSSRCELPPAHPPSTTRGARMGRPRARTKAAQRRRSGSRGRGGQTSTAAGRPRWRSRCRGRGAR